MTTAQSIAVRYEEEGASAARVGKATKNLLALLKTHHPEIDPEPEPIPVLPPISNRLLKFANEIMTDGSPPVPPQPTIREIQDAVCSHFSINRIDLLSNRRQQKFVRPRQIGIYLCRKFTIRSYPEIGNKFGGRDHSTAIAAVERVELLLPTDPNICRSVEYLSAVVSAR